MSNRSSHFVHGLRALPSALAGVPDSSRRLLALAAVLALLALTLQPTTAQAQTEHWSATLTPKSFGTGLGCSNAVSDAGVFCSSSSILTDNSFEYDGKTYSVDQLALFSNGQLSFEVNTNFTAATLSDLTLNIGDTPFQLSDGGGGTSTTLLTWANTGLTWTADTPVAVTLTSATIYAPDDVAVVPPDWPLIPPGISPGQQFRLIFLTSTNRDASSTDIDVYNGFIQDRAAAGHEAIREYRSGFRVVGSTADVDARDNTATTGTGVRIYWLNGNKVADNYGDFYDGSWDDEVALRYESGDLRSDSNSIATGSRHDGTKDTRFGGSALGATTVRLGEPNNAHRGPLQSTSHANTGSFKFYGLSQIFQVDVTPVLQILPDELPEPVDPAPPVVVPPDWELIPDGLGTGSQFRLLFVTSGLYSADSSDIADYNRRVRFNAGWGHAALTAYAGGFRVVGSTASVHAVANTGTVFSDANPGVPIYWVKGKKVADDYADFYDRSWDEEREGRSARGEALRRFSKPRLETSGVWTGIGVGHELGTAEVVMGLPNKNHDDYVGVALAGPLNSNFLGDGEPDAEGGDLDFAPLYGLSQVFQVGDSTTEGPAVPTEPRNLRMETCYVHSYQVTNDNDTPDDDTDDTAETRRRHIPLLLTWDPPASDADESDGIPSSYFYSPYVEVSEDGGAAWEPADGSNAFTTQLSYRLGYYPVGETVRFRVWAKNANGGGPPSEPVSVTIPRCGGGEVWSADVRVTDHPVFDEDTGYSTGHTNSSISDATFKHNNVQYMVTHLYNLREDGAGTIRLILDPKPASAEEVAGLRLHIGDEEPLLLSDGYPSNPGALAFTWRNLDAFRFGNTPFSDGATLAVRITQVAIPPILTITAVRSPVRFLNYEEAGVLPALVDFQVSRTGLWLNSMRFKLTFTQAESLGLPPGPREWNFPAGNRTRTIQQKLLYEEHWAGNRDCAASTCTKPTAVTYRLEECPECGYVLGDPREATVNVISAEPQLRGDDEEEEENTQPLTARFEGLPEGGHGGAGTPFTFRLVFSEAVSATPQGLRDHALKVNNATLEAVSRVDGRSDLWEIRLTPGSNAMVTAALLPAADCDAAGAVCTAGGKMLYSGIGFARQGPPNSSATGAPAISGKARVGETLTADTSGISDADGLTQAVFSFQWVRNDGNADEDIQDATGSTLTLTDAYAGMTVWVEVFFTDDADHEEALTSAATAAVDTPATGLPAISGTARMGETLTADTSGIADADGLTNAVFSHQWIRSYGGDDTEIAGATGSTYTLTIADGASAIKVAVSFTDDEGNEETLASEPTGALASDPGPLAVFTVVDAYKYPVTDLETLVDGGTLTLDNPDTGKYGIRADPDPRHADYGDIHRVELDLNGPKDVYRSEGITPYSLYGDSGENYLKGENLPVGRYTLKATARKKNDDVLGILVVSFTVEAPAENTTATGAPTITGTAQVGQTLTADTSGIVDADGLTNAVFSYQWMADDTNIQDATGSNYTLVSDDEGKAITVTVSFTDTEGNPETLTSDPTGEVAAKPNTQATGQPTITGTVQVGETLTAETSGIADEDGLTNVVFSYQWMADDTNIQDATDLTYTLTEDDEGKAITVRVSFTDDANNEESLTSEPTGPVVPDPGPLTVFKVVDTSSNPDTVLGTLEDGGALTLEDPASGSYGIRVDTDSGHDDHGDIHKVELDLTGAKTRNKEEGVPPYSLYGDEGEGNLEGENLPAGAYELKATAYDDDGDVLGTLKVSFTVTAGQPAQQPTVVPNTSATGVPTISGTVQVGETLTAETLGIADEDGLTNVVFSYQWMADDTNIQDATDLTYTLTEDGEGKAITVRVSFTDDANNEESLTSEPTGPVVPDPGPLTVFKVVDTSSNPDTVLGTLEDGGALTLEDPVSGSYGIRVDTDSGHDDHGDIHKVELDLTGAKTRNKEEGVFPYSLYGDEGEGNLEGENLPAGAYELKATAYDDDGDVLGTLKVSFTVTAGQPAQQPTVVPNTSATGVPTIDGTVQVGQTLTADTSGIADEDGLTNVVFSYQWVADDEDIAGATGSSYTLTEDDEGKTITVTVSFTDAEGNPETLTSDPTGEVEAKPNTSATGQPTISGTVRVGETLTADVTGIADEDGLTNVVFSYQWMADDTNIQGATDATYTLTEDDEGKAIKVTVSFTDAEGNPETLTSDPTGEVEAKPNTQATGAPTISGTLQVGETLTADTSGIADADGLTTVSYSYQWMADDTNIQGATDATYTLAEDDEGKAIKVLVSFTDDAGNVESRPSAPTDAVAAPPAQNSSATGAPSISGTAQVGQTLTADTSGIADEDGLTNAVFSYQWVADDEDIAGATGSSYTLTGDDEGKAITVTVSFTDAEGNPETLTSAPTGEVEAKPNTSATGVPTIDGTAQVGQTLTADTSGIDDEDGLNQVVFSYQWIRNDGNADEDIAGATGSSYTLTGDDEGKTIRVTVSFTDDAEGNPETLTSDPTAEVESQAGPLTGFTLVDAADTDQAVLWKHQTDGSKPEEGDTWKEWTDGGTLALGDPESGRYGIRAEFESDTGIHRVALELTLESTGEKKVDRIDDAAPYSLYGDEGEDALHGESLPVGSYTLKATAYTEDGETLGSLEISFTVALAKPGKPQSLAGEATAQEIKLTWKVPTGSAVVGYVVYRGTLQNGSMNGQALSKYATIDAAGKAMTYTDDNVEEGVEYRYRVAAVNADGEGKKSTWLDITAE